MRNIISIDYKSRLPIYEQLVENIKKLVLSEILPVNSQLPSVRQLSGELGVNPNTVQKAYTTLEQQGVLYSAPGRGSFISADITKIRQDHVDELVTSLCQTVMRLAQAGLGEEELVRHIKVVYERMGKA